MAEPNEGRTPPKPNKTSRPVLRVDTKLANLVADTELNRKTIDAKWKSAVSPHKRSFPFQEQPDVDRGWGARPRAHHYPVNPALRKPSLQDVRICVGMLCIPSRDLIQENGDAIIPIEWAVRTAGEEHFEHSSRTADRWILKKNTLFYKEARSQGLPEDYFKWLCGDDIFDLSSNQFLFKREMADSEGGTDQADGRSASEEPASVGVGNERIIDVPWDDAWVHPVFNEPLPDTPIDGSPEEAVTDGISEEAVVDEA